jgi:hypothetical protein
METQARRLLIRQKLSDGRLPQNSIPRVSGRPSEGEICHACEEVIAEAEMVIEGIVHGSVTPLQLDVDCFYLWYAEWRDASVPSEVNSPVTLRWPLRTRRCHPDGFLSKA